MTAVFVFGHDRGHFYRPGHHDWLSSHGLALAANFSPDHDVPSLFGVLLAFHGIVVFVQEGRFRQLVVKSCAALLLGWQVYALLLPFIVFGAVDVLRRRAPWGSLREAGRAAAAVLCGRHVTLGVVTLLFGMLVLRARFDLYVMKYWFVLVKDRCTPTDARRPFFVHVTPMRVADLDGHRRRFGYNNRNVWMERNGAFDGDRCWLWRSRLPSGIRHIEFGQYIRGVGRTWRAAASLDLVHR